MTIRKVDYLAELKQMTAKLALPDLLGVAGFTIVAGIASVYSLVYALIILKSGSLDSLLASGDVGAPTSWASVLINAVAASLLGPISEEYVFRGLLFTNLQKRLPSWPAILISALLFAVMHFSLSLVTTFIFAICTCIIYYKTKNLWLPIVIHIVSNHPFC